MAQFQKFLFDTAFSANGDVIEAEPPAPTFSAEELESARAAGLAEGRTEGRKEAAQFAARLHTEAITQANSVLQILSAELDTHYVSVRDDAAKLALAIGKSIAGAALARYGEENALAVVEAAMEDLREVSAARLRVAPQVADALGSALEDRAKLQGLSTPIALIADAAIAPGDVRLEFSGGSYSRIAADIIARIETLMQQQDLAGTLSL
jgi:flagellar assembly protein FliH